MIPPILNISFSPLSQQRSLHSSSAGLFSYKRKVPVVSLPMHLAFVDLEQQSVCCISSWVVSYYDLAVQEA